MKPTALLKEAPWADLPPRRTGRARAVPTMLSLDERRAYLWLAEHWATGEGAMVDLGCFAGGSTAHLAEGQRRAGRSGAIHAYDRFTISEALKEKHLYPAGIAPYEGEDLLGPARQLLAPWTDSIALHPGAIEEQVWDSTPIELLVMDASKTARTMDAMAKTFFPALIPGGSLIVQQDLLHLKTPWVAVQMARMRKWVRPVGHAPRDTVIFEVTRPLDEVAITAGRCRDLSDREMIAALEIMADQLAPLSLSEHAAALIASVRANPGVRLAWQMQPVSPNAERGPEGPRLNKALTLLRRLTR
ncbi:class I SAM-dependent methyltransferase [Pontivivens ytuae]|uniref:Uncharacterized protein n=1 Tax=Pontivivens ytuae TaxID=2789856 RepID=A0A7S9QBX2_9RHOB|nr:class I SAM-dependent methyltransferase [Pontivivens ytuae]QPH52461.1 hypothetical protein I0K15_11555 [Pontivivens ytuae]